MGDEVLDVAAREVRHAENTFVDHDEPGALVAVPAEVRLDDGELVVREVAEPLRKHRDRLANDLQNLVGVELVLRKGEAPELDRLAVGKFDLGRELLEARRAKDREVAAHERLSLDPLAAIVELRLDLGWGRAREHFVLGKGDRRGENAGLVEPRLMPRNERHRPPAAVVTEGQEWQRVGQVHNAVPVAEPTLPVRRIELADELHGHRLAWLDCRGKWKAQGGDVIDGELIGEDDIVCLPCQRQKPGLLDDPMPAAALDAERRLEAEHFERLGQMDVIARRDAVMRVEVEHHAVRGGPGRVRPGDAFA